MICNNCHKVFHISDAIIETKKLYGFSVREKKCPLCGGSFRAIELPSDLDNYLYVDRDERYYTYPDKSEN